MFYFILFLYLVRTPCSCQVDVFVRSDGFKLRMVHLILSSRVLRFFFHLVKGINGMG